MKNETTHATRFITFATLNATNTPDSIVFESEMPIAAGKVRCLSCSFSNLCTTFCSP